MTKWLRWLFWLAMLSGAGFAVWTALRRRNEQAAPSPAATPAAPHATSPPAFPPATSEPLASEPIEPAAVPAASQPATTASADTATDAAQRWRKPVDGICPDGFPIKVAKSGIYHVPGGRSYERTVADRCYASADDAEADGYRRAKA